MYAGDLTLDDARRMDAVGNDMANRKFLATWNPREVPEPDRRDKEALREFLWLKYDGSFKRQKPATSASSSMASLPPTTGGYRHDDRYYDDRLHDERGRAGGGGGSSAVYRREHELFREGVSQPPDRSRGYWASRYDNSAQRMPPPPPPSQMRQRDDYYGRGPVQAPPYPDRYRNVAGVDRFQPPQPTQLVPYSRAVRNARARYQEQGLPYEDYGSFNSDERDFAARRNSSLRSRRVDISQDSFGYSDGDLDADREQRKVKSSKSKGRSRRSKSSLHEEGNGYYSDEDDIDVGESSSRRYKKRDSKKSKKSSKSKKKANSDDDEEYDEEEDGFEDDREEDDRGIDGKKSKRQSKKSSEKRSERDKDSVVTVDVDDVNAVGGTPGQAAKTEFDLMSEWMGESKDANTSQVAPTLQNNGVPASGAIPAAMQQAYATQIPMMPPPMSMYGGMMPMPGGGFMPMMPGFVPGMGLPGMPPGMPGALPPGVAPPIPPNMLGMSGGPGVPGNSPMMGPMQGVIGGMQGLNLNQPVPQPASAVQPAPPPPPVGMPAGPAPGPPTEPPES